MTVVEESLPKGGRLLLYEDLYPDSPRLRAKMLARFWAKVEVAGADDCWLWTGAKAPHGKGGLMYGRFCVWRNHENRLQIFTAHRIAFLIANGEIPAGYMVCHTCDNPPCCNPRHLFAGTAKDNAEDRDRKGRGVPPPAPRKKIAKVA